MRPALALLLFILCLVGLALVLGWHKKPPGPGKPDASTQETVAVREGVTVGALSGDVSDPIEFQQNLLEGVLDVSNRYSFTVSIEAKPSTTEEAPVNCSGLFIAPRLILTAGHCVCGWHRAEKSSTQDEVLIDRSACASSAIITAMVYQPRTPGRAPRAIHDRHRGEVRPHPELRIVRNATGQLTTVHANLALIILEEPVQELMPPAKLAASEARLEESLITIGYGSDEIGPTLYGERRFNTSQVVRISEDHERVFLSPPKRLVYQSDSGGPCLRGSPGGDVLVGISNRGLGNESSCVSTYFHRDWLRKESLEATQPR